MTGPSPQEEDEKKRKDHQAVVSEFWRVLWAVHNDLCQPAAATADHELGSARAAAGTSGPRRRDMMLSTVPPPARLSLERVLTTELYVDRGLQCASTPRMSVARLNRRCCRRMNGCSYFSR